jgi:hypothetical protein
MKSYFVVAMLLAAPVVYGQPLQIKLLDELKAKASEVVDLNFNKDMLKLGASFLGSGKQDDPKIKKLVAGLDSFLIKSFEFDKEGAYSKSDLEDLIHQMGRPGWNLIISTDEKKSRETTRIWIKASTPQEVGGMRLLSAEPKELTIIESIGRINLDDLKDLASMGGVRDVTIDHSGKKEE